MEWNGSATSLGRNILRNRRKREKGNIVLDDKTDVRNFRLTIIFIIHSNMGLRKSKEFVSTTPDSDNIQSRRRFIQNFLMILLDTNNSLANVDSQNTLRQLRLSANDVYVFTQRDECVDFLTEVDDRKVFLIATSPMSQQMIHCIHDIPQLVGIYIFCNNETQNKGWNKIWNKINFVKHCS